VDLKQYFYFRIFLLTKYHIFASTKT